MSTQFPDGTYHLSSQVDDVLEGIDIQTIAAVLEVQVTDLYRTVERLDLNPGAFTAVNRIEACQRLAVAADALAQARHILEGAE